MAEDPIEELKRLAYSRQSDAAAASAAQAELARLDAARAEAARLHEAEVARREADAAEREADAARREAEAARREAEGPRLSAPTGVGAATRPRRRLLIALATAAVAAALLGTGVLLLPDSPPVVFERPQDARDIGVPDLALPHGTELDTMRWLGEFRQVSAYGYINDSGDICVTLSGPEGVSGSCASRTVFTSVGIDLLATTGREQGPVELRWGPHGDAEFSSSPTEARG